MSTAVLQNRRVMVLNKHWRFLRFATVRQAFNLVFGTYADGLPKAKILDVTQDYALFTWEDWAAMRPKEGETCIHTARHTFKLPEIIILTHHDKMPRERVHFNRRAIYRRDNYTCQYCGDRVGSEELSIDHVIPKCQGGKTSWDNIVLACTDCNSKKAGRTPEQAGMNLRRKPFRPKHDVLPGDRVVLLESWQQFLDMAYWETEMANDMKKAK